MSIMSQLHAVRNYIGGADAYASLRLSDRMIVISGSHAERIVAELAGRFPVVK